jgi:hypothetical protein
MFRVLQKSPVTQHGLRGEDTVIKEEKLSMLRVFISQVGEEGHHLLKMISHHHRDLQLLLRLLRPSHE